MEFHRLDCERLAVSELVVVATAKIEVQDTDTNTKEPIAMPSESEMLDASIRSKAGHPEVLGETLAKFEFFEKKWNPYSRFLDVDKVDLILRRRQGDRIIYREVQVKFGKLYPCKIKWEQRLFDYTSWRFFYEDEFKDYVDRKDFFVAYVLSRDPTPDAPGYQGDIFIFPVREFDKVIRSSIPAGDVRRKMYLSRIKDEKKKWHLRCQGRAFTEVIEGDTCMDVSRYWRAFDILEPQETDWSLRRVVRPILAGHAKLGP
jgi:hypothetical protein